MSECGKDNGLRPEYDDAELTALLKSGVRGKYTERCRSAVRQQGLTMDEKWDKNKSPVDWYVATELLRFVPDGVDAEDPAKRFLVWENFILVQADNAEMAYEKAMKRRELHDWKSVSGQWHFEGLTSLLAIYEDFEDGAEIMWIERKQKTNRVIKRMVKSKDELEVFSKDKA